MCRSVGEFGRQETLTGSRPADPTTPEIAAARQRTPSTSRRCPQLHAVGGSTYPGQIAIPQGLDGHRFETMILPDRNGE